MIVYLNAENFALIRKAELFPSPGLNVFTGETGAGKSLIVDAITFVCGSGSAAGYAADKNKKVLVEMLLDASRDRVSKHIPEEYRDNEDQLLVSRTYLPSGKSVYKINGYTVNQSVIKGITGNLIDIYGQNEHQSLVYPSKQLQILDALDPDIKGYLAELETSWHKRKTLAEKRDMLRARAKETGDLLDLYTFQLREIREAKIGTDELDTLEAELDRVKNTDRIRSHLKEAYTAINSDNSGITDLLSAAQHSLASAAVWDDALLRLSNDLAEALALTEEASEGLTDYLDELEYDENRVEYLFDRIAVIKRIYKKYGGSFDSVAEHEKRIAEKLEELNGPESDIGSLDAKIGEEDGRIGTLCDKISLSRHKIAALFEKNVVSILGQLGMENILFKVRFTDHEASLSGRESVDFMISPNKGAGLTPLSKTASGGELSRIALAIRLSTTARDMPVLIFDEIDSGISGVTGGILGKMLVELSRTSQILCVTHLTQIAGKGASHFCVSKTFSEDSTQISVKKLDTDERVYEIARMFGDKDSRAAIRHAKEILNIEDQRNCTS